MKKAAFKKGFTLIEFLIILAILIISIAIAFPSIREFQQSYDLKNSAEGIINNLRLAQTQTLASEGGQYGIYFNDLADPQEYVLFKGESYATRYATSDVVYYLPESVIISAIDLWGGKEVVFERLTGSASSTSPYGMVSIQLSGDASSTKDIYIGNSGLIEPEAAPTSSDVGRITDSRHIHFDYNGRNIATDTEKIKLDFSGDIFEITIADNLVGGQIYWEDDVSVSGQTQHLKIHTHKLNDSLETEFCVHRDGRYNNAALTISLSGGADTDSLIIYDAAGQETKGSSVYLPEDPERQ